MANIMLFGSSSLHIVPYNVLQWLEEYNKQGHKFIVGDRKGADSAFHKTLSSIGANNVQLYCMDSAKNNVYDFPVKRFMTAYNEETKEAEVSAEDNSIEPVIISGINKVEDIALSKDWYEFRDRQLIKDCDMAICLWDGETKATTQTVRLLNIHNKPCYTFTIQQQ